MTIIAAGCALGQGDIAAGCAGGQAGAVSASPPSTDAPTPPAQQDDETAVCAAFAAYRKALVDRNALAALALVPDSTIEYYDSLAKVAGTGGPEEIGARS
ncbi:MAG: hypothetical protein ACRDQ0_07700, partial [Pseudonocardia sp.]